MALDPESQKIIEAMVAANRPAWHTLSPEAAREAYLAATAATQLEPLRRLYARRIAEIGG